MLLVSESHNITLMLIYADFSDLREQCHSQRMRESLDLGSFDGARVAICPKFTLHIELNKLVNNNKVFEKMPNHSRSVYIFNILYYIKYIM